MKNEREFAGTLSGFDDYVNMVLENVTELCVVAFSVNVKEAKRALVFPQREAPRRTV